MIAVKNLERVDPHVQADHIYTYNLLNICFLFTKSLLSKWVIYQVHLETIELR